MSTDAPPRTGASARIGVFDSGVGGLSVLRALHRHLPQATLLYAADSAHAPYGERDPGFVIERSRALTAHLLREGAQLIVVACNTATAAAIDALRAEHPRLPVVGVEPGLKPALAQTRNRRIGVMATHATLASERFRRLVDAHAADVSLHLQACGGLARALESGDADGDEVAALVQQHTAALREAGVDTVVLGCTHYAFAAHRIKAALGPGVSLIDTADAVARQAAKLAALLPAPATAAAGPAVLWTSADPAQLRTVAGRWLDFEVDVCALPPARVPGATA